MNEGFKRATKEGIYKTITFMYDSGSRLSDVAFADKIIELCFSTFFWHRYAWSMECTAQSQKAYSKWLHALFLINHTLNDQNYYYTHVDLWTQ